MNYSFIDPPICTPKPLSTSNGFAVQHIKTISTGKWFWNYLGQRIIGKVRCLVFESRHLQDYRKQDFTYTDFVCECVKTSKVQH